MNYAHIGENKRGWKIKEIGTLLPKVKICVCVLLRDVHAHFKLGFTCSLFIIAKAQIYQGLNLRTEYRVL